MRILVTGGKGQLGRHIKHVIEKGCTDIGEIDDVIKEAEIRFTDAHELNITNFDETVRFIKSYKPDVVVNCAAYTNVDMCEKDSNSAFSVNAIGARNLAVACEKISAEILHVSTDYVFDGRGTNPYREYDVPCPVNVYGKSKLLGEQYVRDFCSRYYIVRTSWLYGEYGKNFVKTILGTAQEKGSISVVDDQTGCPTYAEDLVYYILKLIQTDEYGIYHCSGNGECSWYDLAARSIEHAVIDAEIKRIKTSEITRDAVRPMYSVMDNMMLRCTIGDRMRPWDEALSMFVERWKEKQQIGEV